MTQHTPVIVRRAFAGQPSEIIITWDGKTLQANDARKLVPLYAAAPEMKDWLTAALIRLGDEPDFAPAYALLAAIRAATKGTT